MVRGAWQATVHRVTTVGHDLATKPPPPPTPVFWPGEFHELYSPWGHKDTTERLSLHYLIKISLIVIEGQIHWETLDYQE